VPCNPSSYAFSLEQTLPQLFEQQASKTPYAVAAVFGVQKLQYRELNRRANQLARYLRDRGASPGSLVGIAVERSLDMIVGILAILKTGAAYVPLDPSYPRDRLAWMLADCGAPVLLTASSVADCFTGYGGLTLCLDHEGPAIRHEKTDNLAYNPRCSDRAYVMYTSGSTGWPKGIEIAHRSVVNAAHAMRAKIGMDARDVLVSVSSPAFDIHVLDVWMPLVCGACVAVAPAAACRDGGELASEIARAGGTVMQATPSTWQLLLDARWHGSRRLTAVCGGEALTGDLAARLGEKIKDLWNAYGPTETTVWSSAYRARGREDIVPIGRPLANTQFHVLDEHRCPAPAGVAGELHIGGEGLALGYLNQPELTAERFIAHPFDRAGSRRLYRTGDRVRQRPDGNFEFLGRLDHQVKLRGFRIELDEISAVLKRHPGVKDAVTILNEQNGGYKHLGAYVITTPEHPARPEDLRKLLRTTLPDHMVPTHLTFLEALPRLPNGKVDNRRLSEPEQLDAVDRAVTGPRDALESNLAAIFEEVLGKGPIDTGLSFFDLGGDSVLVAKLLRRIEDTVGTRLPMAIVFQASTIEQLARVLRENSVVTPAPGVIPIQTGCGAPFLCLGAGPSFLPLVRLLGGDLRFLGLDLGLIDSTQLAHPYRLEDFAVQVAQRIVEMEPKGPYYIGGWCRYGPLAYETAQQLMTQGGEVALLTLIDSANPSYYAKLSAAAKVEMLVQRLGYHLSNLKKSKAVEIPRYFGRRIRVLRYRVKALRAGVNHSLDRVAGNAGIEELEHILHLASARYDPPLYTGRVAMFQSAERPRGCHWDLQGGWRGFIQGRFDAYDIPGGHESMLQEPHVQVFASHLRQCLALECYLEADAT